MVAGAPEREPMIPPGGMRRPNAVEKNEGVTEVASMDDRGHALTIDSGRANVADTAPDFVKRLVKSASRYSRLPRP